MNKPWYHSMTVISAIIFAGLQAAETNGVIPDGGTQSLAQALQALSTVGIAFGLRRALPQ